jgi:hypothetical protein
MASPSSSLGKTTPQRSVDDMRSHGAGYLADLDSLAVGLCARPVGGHSEAAAAVRRIAESVTVMPAPIGTAPEL